MTAVGRLTALGLGVLGTLVVLGFTLGWSCQQSTPVVTAPAPTVNYDVTPRPVIVIAPGTVIGDGPPDGWTHLLVKSYTRAEAGDTDKMSSSMRELADKLFSTMVARVEVDPTSSQHRHVLAKVASGVGTRIGDRDVIVSLDTHKQLGANMGFLGPWALETAYGRVKAAAIVLRSETIAVDDAPMLMLRHERHAPVILRYAFLLDPATGRLETLQWFIDQDTDGTYRDAHGPMQLLPQSHVENRIVHVDASKFAIGGFLTEQSLALTKLYTGRQQIAFPAGFEELARQKPFTPESAAVFEATLRRLIRDTDSP